MYQEHTDSQGAFGALELCSLTLRVTENGVPTCVGKGVPISSVPYSKQRAWAGPYIILVTL